MNSFPPKVLEIRQQALAEAQPLFTLVDEIAEKIRLKY